MVTSNLVSKNQIMHKIIPLQHNYPLPKFELFSFPVRNHQVWGGGGGVLQGFEWPSMNKVKATMILLVKRNPFLAGEV